MFSFSGFSPDTPNYPNNGESVALNVYPRSKFDLPKNQTGLSYGPLGTPSYTGQSLTNRAQGFFSCKDQSGNPVTFAGDSSALYKYSTSGWANVSKTGGYHTRSDYPWSFSQYGSTVIATNGVDNPQAFILGTSTVFADLASGAPVSNYSATIKDFCFLGGDGLAPNRIRWSGIDQPGNFPTPGTSAAQQVQSDQNYMPDGSQLRGITGGAAGADGFIFCENAIYRAQYVGPPNIFDFPYVDRTKGTPAPGSIVNAGSFVAWLGTDGFYIWQGQMPVSIGTNKIDKLFWQDVNQTYLVNITSALDPINKLIFWSYVSNASNGTPDKVLIYNYAIGEWSQAAFPHEMIGNALSQGFTLQQLNSFGNISNLPFSFGSRVWMGGKPLLGMFNTAHSIGYLSGSAMAATVTTGAMPVDGGIRTQILSSRPITDAPTASMALGVQNLVSDVVTFTTPVAMNSYGACPQRCEGRYISAQINIPAGTTWSHIQGFEITGKPKGVR